MQMFNHDEIEFEVEKFVIPEVPTNLGVGLRRKDTGKVLSIVSENYNVIQYKDIVDKLEDALTLASQDSSINLDLNETKFDINVIDNGAKLELRARFHGQKTFLNGSTGFLGTGGNDMVVPEFVFRTSHDRTWANNGMMGIWRAKCWNTLVAGNKLAYVYGRHTKNFDVLGFAGKIGRATQYISGEGMDKIKMWYETPVKRDQVIELFKNTVAKRTDNVSRENEGNKIMLSNLMKIFDEESRHITGRGAYQKYGTNTGGTLYNIYNAATYWSSHPSLMTGKNAGTLYEGSDISEIPENKIKIKNREDRVVKMIESNAWKNLEMTLENTQPLMAQAI